MNKLIVCRILSEINPIQYKHIKTCICPIFMCSENNLKLQQNISYEIIPYIECKLKKQKNPTKYILSHNCNCTTACKYEHQKYFQTK